MRGYAAIIGVFRQKRGFLPDRDTIGFNPHFKLNPRVGAGTRGQSARVAGAAAGPRRAMVGDGVIGSGTDVAIEASDITLISGDPCNIGDAIRLSRRTLGDNQGQPLLAFAYNVAALPLAAGFLNPLIAGVAMGLLQRLRRHQLAVAAGSPG